MGEHLIEGRFQSDRYPTCPRGKVPLSTKDKTAQDLLWIYAQRRRVVDASFSDDLETALENDGFEAKQTDERMVAIQQKCARTIFEMKDAQPSQIEYLIARAFRAFIEGIEP